jgi:hypothetical protein
LVYARVESVGLDEQEPLSLAIRLAAVPGLADTTLKIARDQMDAFLAIVGLARQENLVGCSVRVTVDDDAGTERIAFLTTAEPAPAAEPVAFSPEPIEPSRGIPVMADERPADEITIYDGIGWTLPAAVHVTPGAGAAAGATAAAAAAATTGPTEASAAVTPDSAKPGAGADAGATVATPAAASDEECAESAVSWTPAEQVIEEQARAELAAAAAAPVDQRYFLYRETYEPGPQQSVTELTPEEFALLGGAGAYLHVDDCTVVGARDLPPDVAQGIERLLDRATSREEAGLPRAEVERLASAGRVVSCAVY